MRRASARLACRSGSSTPGCRGRTALSAQTGLSPLRPRPQTRLSWCQSGRRYDRARLPSRNGWQKRQDVTGRELRLDAIEVTDVIRIDEHVQVLAHFTGLVA